MLNILDCKNKIFTGDAGFCNRVIVDDIVNKGGSYIFQVKKNQIKLYESARKFFSEMKITNEFIEENQGHNRKEKRIYQVLGVEGNIEEKYLFSDMQSIIHVISYRQEKDREETCEDRYYISSLKESELSVISESIRSHWHIENKLHYVLDVTLKEDESRITNLVGAENMLLFRRAVLSLLRQVKTKDTIPCMLINAALSDEYRSNIMSMLF